MTEPLPLPEPTTMPDGRIGWPEIFRYRWTDLSGEHVEPCPSPERRPVELQERQARAERLTGGRTPFPGAQRCGWPHVVEVAPGRLDDYDRLVRAGAVYLPEHTGRQAGVSDTWPQGAAP